MLDLADLGNQTLILEEAALVTLGVALVGVDLRLHVGYTNSNWRLLVVLLIPPRGPLSRQKSHR